MNRKVVLTSVQPLPSGFAENVLELEAKVELESSLDSLRSLLQLYSVITTQQAIEFYESKKDQKYLFYEQKMKQLLNKKYIFLSNSLPASPKSLPDSLSSPKLSEMRKADLSIKEHNAFTTKISRDISLNLQSQDSLLTQKLSIRKMNSPKMQSSRPLLKSRTFTFPDRDFESDHSAGTSIYVEELEGVMESFISEKLRRSKEIKRKYKEEICEVLKMEGGLVERVVEQMKKDMTDELSDLERRLDDDKKIAISQLKSLINK